MLRRTGGFLILALVLVLPLAAWSQYGAYSSRGLLEKKIYYVDENGKLGTATYWSLYLGKHSCTIKKNFPGEGTVTLQVEVNFNLLSSLYIEGKGYSTRGKTDVDARFAIADGDSLKGLEADSIEFICDYGEKVKPVKGALVPLVLNPEDNQLKIQRLLLRTFHYDNDYKELKFDKDIALRVFAFSQAAIQEAQKTCAEK